MTSISEGYDYIDELSDEILLNIFSLFDFKTIVEAHDVCERWKRLSVDSMLWKDRRLVLGRKNYEYFNRGIVRRVETKLTQIRLSYFNLYAEIRQQLIRCSNLTKLEIIMSYIDPDMFVDLKYWPELRILSFFGSICKSESNGNDTFDLPLNCLVNLTDLTLSNFKITQKTLENILLCRRLNSVNMESMKNVPGSFLIRLLNDRAGIMESLHVCGDTLTADVIESISNCTNLKTLHIHSCRELFNSALNQLTRLENLESLKLRRGYFTAEALRRYFSSNVRFKRLKCLNLSRGLHVNIITAETMKKNCPVLEYVNLHQCPRVQGHRELISTMFDYVIF